MFAVSKLWERTRGYRHKEGQLKDFFSLEQRRNRTMRMCKYRCCVWAVLNIEVLRTDGGEARWGWSSDGMQGWVKRENPPISDIARQNSRSAKIPGATPPGIDSEKRGRGREAKGWLDYSSPTRANRDRFLVRSFPDFRMWTSCWMMPLVGGFSRRTPVSPAPFNSSIAQYSSSSALRTSMSSLAHERVTDKFREKQEKEEVKMH
ncbi:hypothetical protein PR048_022380 [Dryococelus australis]|uniref:Uncharacterized protein n=1 Tax=Dryococelus australis TaxID=614101 RepID=A0ABQ9H0U0_9NEOP|nr:hypothetical protein PR048_022380 [Dryococelus australis]